MLVIHYYAETVKPGYSILLRDVIADGEFIESATRVGSPAPTATVKHYERRTVLK